MGAKDLIHEIALDSGTVCFIEGILLSGCFIELIDPLIFKIHRVDDGHTKFFVNFHLWSQSAVCVFRNPLSHELASLFVGEVHVEERSVKLAGGGIQIVLVKSHIIAEPKGIGDFQLAHIIVQIHPAEKVGILGS